MSLGAQSSSSIRNFGSPRAPAVRVEHALAAGETARYAVRASAGDLLRVVVERPGPLTIRVTDAANLPVAERARVEPRDGPETLSWVAAQSGLYRIELRPREPRRPSGTHCRHAGAAPSGLRRRRPRGGRRAALGARRCAPAHGSRQRPARRPLRLRRRTRRVARTRDAAGEAEALLGAGLTHRSLTRTPKRWPPTSRRLRGPEQSGDRWLKVVHPAEHGAGVPQLGRARAGARTTIRTRWLRWPSLERSAGDTRVGERPRRHRVQIRRHGDGAAAVRGSAQPRPPVGDPRVEGYAVQRVGNVYSRGGTSIVRWRRGATRWPCARPPAIRSVPPASLGQHRAGADGLRQPQAARPSPT